MEKISPPVRILAIVLVLVGVAGMLALRTMGPSAEPEAIPVPVQKPAKAAPAKQASEPAKAAAAKPAATAKAATPKRTPAAAKPRTVNPVVPKSGFPSAVDAELRRNEIVVVALVVPGARVVEIAAAEPRQLLAQLAPDRRIPEIAFDRRFEAPQPVAQRIA